MTRYLNWGFTKSIFDIIHSKYHKREVNEMDFNNIETIEQLKKLGNFRKVKEKISSLLDFSIKAKSWSELVKKIENIKKVFCKNTSEIINKEERTTYFISPSHELAYHILKHKQGFFDKELGISKKHYMDKKEARKWRDKMVKKFHPDYVKFNFAEEVTAKINKIYKQMVGR